MATLSSNKVRDYGVGNILAYPVVADDIIFQGAAVGENASGYSRPLVAGDVFQGFAEEKADNSGGSAGAVNVRVKAKGYIKLPVDSLAITGNDRQAVYASDDDTFTLTSTDNSLIGYIAQWLETGYAIVEFDAALCKAALHA